MKRRRLLDRTVVLSRILPARELMKTEYYNGFMSKTGEKYALSMSLKSHQFGRTSLTFYRGDKTGGDFTDEDARRLDELRPFMRNALLLRSLVREKGRTGKGLQSVRDPAFLVSPENEIRPLNPAGEDFLCSRCKAAIPNPYEARFQKGEAHAIPVAANPHNGAIVTIPGAGPEEEPRRSDRLRLRFGLTPMESAVAGALIDGLAYKEIAEEFAVSTETVHSHVKAIHRKADVDTTRQFVALFFSGR
jgi:DNA-binding CsgD family transcriptional regulator